MSKAPGRCIFCGATGVTKEHVLARSLAKLFIPAPQPDVTATIQHRHSHPEDGVEPKTRSGSGMLYVTRKVCRDCNGGWMNRCDQAARPALEAFATGAPKTISRDEEEALALWAAKVSMCFMSLDPPEYRFADVQTYRDIAERGRPPDGLQVWLGANNHGDIAWFRAHALTFADRPDQPGWGASLSFGFSVLYIAFHGRTDERLRLRYNAHRAFRQIWPPAEPVDWPPALPIDRRDLTGLAVEIRANSAFERI